MSLFRQSVTVTTKTQSAGGSGFRGVPEDGTPQTVLVGFETSPRGVDCTQYGIESANAAVLRCRLSDRTKFPIGSEVAYLTDAYTVLAAAGPMQGGSLGYAEFILQRQTL